MKKFQVPETIEDMKAHDEIVEWLHTMTQEWDGDESGINIYPPMGPNGEVYEVTTAWVGDWVVEEDGVFRVVKASDYDEFMKQYRFETTINFATLNAFIKVKVLFEESYLVQVEIKHEEEVLIMSSDMFFALMGADAHQIYEKATEAEQNERLSK